MRRPLPRLAGSVLGSLLLTGCAGAAGSPRSATSSVPAAPVVREVLGLGDSVPAGGACGCRSFVTLLAESQQRDQSPVPTAVRNEAVSGLTSQGLLDQVTHEGLVAAPGTATVVTIGANDFSAAALTHPACRGTAGLACFHPGLVALGRHLDATLRLLSPSGGSHSPVLLTGYWNVFLDGSVGRARGAAYVRDSAALTRAVNAVIAGSAQRAGQTYVDLYGPFRQRGASEDVLLATDGDHPSAAGHVLIAQVLQEALRLVLGRQVLPAGRDSPR